MHTSRSLAVLIIIAVAVSAGCSLIAGKEDPAGRSPLSNQLRIEYRETLRNQASLRGEAFRETDFGAPPALSLQRPSSVTADTTRVYVTDLLPTPRLAIFDRGDRTMKIITSPTPTAVANISLFLPSGVAVDETGFIYLADAQQGRVFCLDRNGSLLLIIGRAGELAFPSALAVDIRRGRLYIADKNRHVVRAYTMHGDPLFVMGGSGNQKDLKSPVGIALDRAGNGYILDTHGSRVHVFDPDGKFIRVIPLAGGATGGKMRSTGIAVDSAGHIYVTDGFNNMVLIYGADGTFLQSWGRTGTLRGDFWIPAGIFIDAHDTIYIADQTNGRIQVYQYEK